MHYAEALGASMPNDEENTPEFSIRLNLALSFSSFSQPVSYPTPVPSRRYTSLQTRSLQPPLNIYTPTTGLVRINDNHILINEGFFGIITLEGVSPPLSDVQFHQIQTHDSYMSHLS